MVAWVFTSSSMEQNDPIFRALASALELLAKPADYQKNHLDKFHEAADILRRILEKNPLDGRSLLLLGRHEWKEGDHARASIHFERAAKVEEYEPDALVEHARMQVELEKYEKAVELLEDAQFARPRDHVARYLDSVRNALRARRSH